jgi:hypothetical protein
MTMATITRADWSSVTLAEYAAINLLARPDVNDALDRTWDDIHEHNPFRGDTPNRLTDDGRAWLAQLHQTVTRHQDEHAVIAAGRELVKALGLLTVMATARKMGVSR